MITSWLHYWENWIHYYSNSVQNWIHAKLNSLVLLLPMITYLARGNLQIIRTYSHFCLPCKNSFANFCYACISSEVLFKVTAASQTRCATTCNFSSLSNGSSSIDSLGLIEGMLADSRINTFPQVQIGRLQVRDMKKAPYWWSQHPKMEAHRFVIPIFELKYKQACWVLS